MAKAPVVVPAGQRPRGCALDRSPAIGTSVPELMQSKYGVERGVAIA